MNTRVCAASTRPKHLKVQSSNRKTTITHNNFRHCRARFFSIVRPYSKQLYTTHLSRSLLEYHKTSCMKDYTE